MLIQPDETETKAKAQKMEAMLRRSIVALRDAETRETQMRGYLLALDSNGLRCYCATGIVMEALGMESDDLMDWNSSYSVKSWMERWSRSHAEETVQKMRRVYDFLQQGVIIDHSVTVAEHYPYEPTSLELAIVHMNDARLLSFQQIADELQRLRWSEVMNLFIVGEMRRIQ